MGFVSRATYASLLVLAALLWGGVANSQDWCGAARTPTEELICLNPDLGALEERVVRAFAAALENAGNKAELATSQREWAVRRNSCGDDYDCVLTVYESRIKSLEGTNRRKAESAEVTLPSTVAIPPPRSKIVITFDAPAADPACDFATTRSSSCAAYAADTLRRYHRYVRASIDAFPGTSEPTDDGADLHSNIELCSGDPWCLWRKYSKFAEDAYNLATYKNVPIVDAPDGVERPPLYADGQFSCTNLGKSETQLYRLRLTRWIDENNNRVLALNDYGRWNIILIDEQSRADFQQDDLVSGWWQIRLVEDKGFLQKIWEDSRRNAWIVVRHAPGSGTLESIYAFGNGHNDCYTFPDAFEPLRELRILPDEVVDYFYDSLVAKPTSTLRLDYPFDDISRTKVKELEAFLADESRTKGENASNQAKISAAQSSPGRRKIERSKTLMPSPARKDGNG